MLFRSDGADIVYHVLASGVAELRGSKGALVKGEDIFPFRPTTGSEANRVLHTHVKRLGEECDELATELRELRERLSGKEK